MFLFNETATTESYTLALHDALPIFSLLKVVSDLHAGAGRPTRLWSKLNFRMSLVPVDRKAANIHVHGAHIQSADGIQVLHDAGADGRAVARLPAARARAEKPTGQ